MLRLAALGLTKASIAKKLSLGEATVYRILARERAQKQSKSQKLNFDRIDGRFCSYVVTAGADF